MEGSMGTRLILAVLAAGCVSVAAQDTFQPATAETVPKTFEELWAPFDPRKEPLDVEVLKESEEDGVVLKVLRFRVGIFKGRKAMMAAVYGYPKGGRNLPGLVQAHGGGQFAQYEACLTNAKRGYATISLAWTGRLRAPGYNVGGGEVRLFWEGKTDDPNYRITTDWGALDAYHAPGRYRSDFGSVKPDEHTIDPVESPRNSAWFLCALGARRALTFLEQQPEVDGERLGVYGHSMGGQITSYTVGSDPRVKAAAPSCGGISYRGTKNLSEELGFGNAPYLRNTTCPIIFLSPANDFHGRISSLPLAVSEIKSTDWRVTCGPHHNHQDTAPFEVATQLWFDKHLKGTFQWPATPKTETRLKTPTGVPSITVRPDMSKSILSVHVYYTQQGATNESHLNKIHRFWRSAELVRQGDAWTAELPVFSTDRPLWVYANVHYPLDEPVSGVGYYYQPYTAKTFNVSSVVELFEPGELQTAGVKSTITPSTVIEDFRGDWEQEWFTYNRGSKIWERKTNKVYDPMCQAPDYAKLAFGMSSRQAGKLTIAVDGHSATFELNGSGEWEDVVLLPLDLTNKEGDGRLDWQGLHGLSLVFRSAKAEDAIAPQLRNLRWVEGTREELNARREVRLDEADVVDGRTYLDIRYADRVRQDIDTHMNTSFGGQPLAIGAKTYQRGIGTHANSEILFFLKGKYSRFHAETGSQKGLPASIRFTVLADGKPVFESGMMTRDQGPKIVDLDVAGVTELELVVDDGGNGKHADHANWADAYLTKQAKLTYLDVPYDIHERTKLNFWQAKGEGPRPLVVIIHGGGWLGRNKGDKPPAAFLSKGISVAAINYRYSSIAPLPAPVHDAVRAIQFLRYKAADWNIDKNRIVLTGDSAGGCTSVWIACHDDLANPDSDDPIERESSRIQGAAVAGAQTAVDPKQIKEWVGEQYAVHGMIHWAVGETSPEAIWQNYAKHEATFKEFSAINHLSPDDPPMFLAYDADLTVPAKSCGHAIHHGLFGVKFREKSKAVGHNKVYLAIGKDCTSQYANPSEFITNILLK